MWGYNNGAVICRGLITREKPHFLAGTQRPVTRTHPVFPFIRGGDWLCQAAITTRKINRFPVHGYRIAVERGPIGGEGCDCDLCRG